ncbi:similar to Saccharomyces cerevisiae YJR022W LSM8 Lsm (Like Sm) protein [Geotrichum candidum]|uniref:LSM2-LSM8 complex subunit LSM8 n=1 Tax=Geotrichum candidum TaxID=1173061 RepID=A0A0J9X873_GEOCN|nr:similar to Saccharomyces cerevisiae YJR022W LSM8 Lsm (Like Sm) protein [Geotrichum candidum]
MSSLNPFLEKPVIVITTDGRTFVGTLQGYDQSTNIILTDTQERIITPDEPTEIIDLGLYLLRGDSIVVCGLVDEEINNSIDWTKVRGNRIDTTRHAT